MSFSVVNNAAVINGDKGIYDNKVNNSSVKYARNSVSNYKAYLKEYKNPTTQVTTDFSNLKNLDNDTFEKRIKKLNENSDKALTEANAMPPVKFEYKYMPNGISAGKIDKKALLAAAFEEMGKTVSIPVESDDKKTFKDAFGENVDAKVLDINGDNKIDIGEYSSTILLADMLGKSANEVDSKNITGVIKNDGQNRLLAYIDTKNNTVASGIILGIHKAFNLEAAQNEFESDANNLAP